MISWFNAMATNLTQNYTIYRHVLGAMTTVKRHFIPEFCLNTALCQSPPEISKTRKAMDFIKYVTIQARALNGPEENGIHHITIVSTNRNLEETKQWRYRTSKTFKGINILTLSSKKGDINSIDIIIKELAKVKSANALPDIIIFCTHSRRIDDVLELIGTINNGRLNFNDIGIRQITITQMFDEADENRQLIARFLKNMEKEINESSEESYPTNYTLRDVHLITATPLNDFWQSLKPLGITRLKNINKLLRNATDSFNIPYDELMKEYRSLNDHRLHTETEDIYDSAEQYAQVILKKIMVARESRAEKALTIFAPAELEIASHRNMRDMFSLVGFHVMVHNGAEKGIYDQDGVFESIASFNSRHNIQGELRETLVKWREMNPTADIAITGLNTISRGITFCTIGFNFSDIIISRYHMIDIAKLIQLLGRANGGKDFVQPIDIWAPKIVMDAANEQIEINNAILREDPEEFEGSQFCKPTQAELNAPAKRVPIIVQLTTEEFTSIGKSGKSWNDAQIMTLIREKNSELADELATLDRDQITMPEKPNSIKKQITDIVAGALNNKTKVVSIKGKNKDKNIYQIFMDKHENRLIVTRFYGKLITTPLAENNIQHV